MADSGKNTVTVQGSMLEHLKSLQIPACNLDVAVETTGRSGNLYIRDGKIVAADCGRLRGNGALMSLAVITDGSVGTREATHTVEGSVSLDLTRIEKLFQKLPHLLSSGSICEEGERYEKALQFFLRFQRQEASAAFVQILRCNRFYYPAWLWHSRLMTRPENIKKALNEAKIWGNSDPEVNEEVRRILPQLEGSEGTVRRCIFCWSIMGVKEKRCPSCRAFLSPVRQESDGVSTAPELQRAIQMYKSEIVKDKQNSRLAYCLFLGHYSRGEADLSQTYIERALQIAPQERLFQKVASLLKKSKGTVAHAVKQKDPASVAAPVALRPSPKSRGQSILVVEDSRTARQVVTMLLKRKGFNVLEAQSGSEALAVFSKNRPDLVLLDLMLPDTSGYEVLAKIRQHLGGSDVPVIMLTGKRGATDRTKGMAFGANEYLTKPFDPGKLLDIIDNYLEKKEDDKGVEPANYVQDSEPAESHPEIVKTRQIVEQPIPAPADVSQEPEEAAAPPPQSNGKTILVVEDSPTTRKVISLVLTKSGYLVEEAETGGEALTKVKSVSPHLILLDAMLPDTTGYAVLTRLKADETLKNIPVVMLTAKTKAIDKQKGLQLGSVEYLTKPFDPEKLLSVIGGYI